MSDPHERHSEPEGPATCPTCGSPLPTGARYCPICGTRVQPTAGYDPDAFRSAVDDVLDDRETAPLRQPHDTSVRSDFDTTSLPVQRSEPNQEYEQEQPPAVTVHGPEPTSPAEPIQPSWASSPSGPTIQTPASSIPAAAPPPRERRTMWIILAILGGIVFCCCSMFFLLFAVSSVDSSFQGEISLVAVLMQVPPGSWLAHVRASEHMLRGSERPNKSGYDWSRRM